MLFIFLSLAILFLTILIFHLRIHTKIEPFHPPPGPKGLPLIGNLHQFDASKPHVYFGNLAKIYGPILSFRFGRVPIVVVQSAKLAKEVLQAQDLNFCNRPQTVAIRKLSYNCLDIVFSPYNEYFREMKKISVVHLLSSKRVERYALKTQEEVLRLIKKITFISSTSQIVNLSELVMGYSCSNICNIAFGKRYEDDDERSKSRFHSLLNEAQAMFGGFFISDYFPLFGWLDKLNGNVSRLERVFKDLDEFFEEIIKDHLYPNKPHSMREDIIDVLLNLKEEQCSFHLTFDHIKAILMNIFIAGTDTSAAMIIWAMTELMKHPTSMKKVQEELRSVAPRKDYINNDDVNSLKYFKAIVKEIFRLHPGTPMLVARETIRKSFIEGYDVLPKTLVYINAWAIGRDPCSWKDANEFMPERFLENYSTDFKGYDFELIPFGAGRRICPGMNFGVANMELALANLLYTFDWELPKDTKTEDIDTDVLPGVTMHKKNQLCLVAKIPCDL